MKIIIGLGNPGKEYEGTRHNIGFEIVEKLRTEWNFPEFSFDKKFDSEVSDGQMPASLAGGSNVKCLLVRPQTFMNNSGEAVQKILSYYKLLPNDLIVIHDDLDIALGKYKIATDSSSAGHNGVQDIMDKLGTQKFKRIRIGIGEAADEGAIKCRLDAHDFVLQKFTEEEMEKIKAIEKNILDELKKLL